MYFYHVLCILYPILSLSAVRMGAQYVNFQIFAGFVSKEHKQGKLNKNVNELKTENTIYLGKKALVFSLKILLFLKSKYYEL